MFYWVNKLVQVLFITYLALHLSCEHWGWMEAAEARDWWAVGHIETLNSSDALAKTMTIINCILPCRKPVMCRGSLPAQELHGPAGTQSINGWGLFSMKTKSMSQREESLWKLSMEEMQYFTWQFWIKHIFKSWKRQWLCSFFKNPGNFSDVTSLSLTLVVISLSLLYIGAFQKWD